MSDESKIGEMVWMDLTVNNATEVQQFYQHVVGWKVENVSMGDYNDYSMNTPETNTPITGVCHAKGPNADMPAAWMPYFLVADVEASSQQVKDNGGTLITPIKSMGNNDRYVVLKDPAGAICALYQKGN